MIISTEHSSLIPWPEPEQVDFTHIPGYRFSNHVPPTSLFFSKTLISIESPKASWSLKAA
jgi:hypothetical protein